MEAQCPRGLRSGRAGSAVLRRGSWALLAERSRDLALDLAGALDLPGRQGDRADHRVTAAAVTRADRGDVVRARHGRPGVAPHRDLRARAAGGDRDAVARLGE